MSEINARKVPARTRGRADTRASVLIYRSPSRLCETERSASDRDDGFIAEKNRSNPTRRAVIPTKSIGDRWQREGGGRGKTQREDRLITLIIARHPRDGPLRGTGASAPSDRKHTSVNRCRRLTFSRDTRKPRSLALFGSRVSRLFRNFVYRAFLPGRIGRQAARRASPK